MTRATAIHRAHGAGYGQWTKLSPEVSLNGLCPASAFASWPADADPFSLRHGGVQRHLAWRDDLYEEEDAAPYTRRDIASLVQSVSRRSRTEP